MIGGRNLLLDTCALLIASANAPMKQEASRAIDAASVAGELFVSPISAWEFGQLMRRGRLRSQFSAIEFFDQLVVGAACLVCELTPAIMANSSFLPNLDHRDPADCMMIATARALDCTLVTRDKTILDYGALGYVRTLAC